MTLIESLGYTLLHSLWQGAVLAVLLAVSMLFFSKRSAQFRYFIAITALFTMLVVAGFTFCNLYFFSSHVTQTDALSAQPATGKSHVAGETITIQLAPIQESLYEKCSHYFEEHLPLIVVIWLAGVLILTLRFIGGLAYIRRMQTYRIEKVSEEWFATTQEIAEKLGIRRTVKIWESALAKVPVAIGYFKPVILLPIGTFTGLSPQQIEAILAHELAHIARNDYWVNLIQSVLEIVFFFHPAIWWMSGVIRQERENCCDDLAVQLNGNGLVFAQALTNLEIFRSAPQLAMAANRGSLLPRIQRLIQKSPQKATFSEGLLASGVVLMCLLAVSVSAVAQWQQKEPGKEIFDAQDFVLTDTASYKTGDRVFKTSFEDTSKKVRELVIVKNKKGKVTEVVIDGKKLPKSQLKDYEKYIEKALKEADEKEEWTIMDEDMLEVPLLPDPPLAPAPPEALAIVESPELLALTEVFDSEIQLRNQCKSLYEELEELNKYKAIAPASESSIWDRKIQEKQELLEKYKRQLSEIKHRNQEFQELNNIQLFKEQEAINLQNLQLEDVHLQAELAKKEAELAQQQAKIAEKEAQEMQIKHEKMYKELGEELKKDGLIDDAKHFRFRITKEELFINGKKQPDIIFEKYKKWMKQNYKVEIEQFGDNSSFEISTNQSNRNFNSSFGNGYIYGSATKPAFRKPYSVQRSYQPQAFTFPRETTVITSKPHTLSSGFSSNWNYAYSLDDSVKASYNENFDPKEMLITVKLKNSFVKVYKGKEHIEVKVDGKYPAFMINNREVLFQEVEKLTSTEIENIEGGNAGGFYNKNPNGYINIRTKRK
jgi:beta-lactamase regulating signal transducer with metallopeptidase domain